MAEASIKHGKRTPYGLLTGIIDNKYGFWAIVKDKTSKENLNGGRIHHLRVYSKSDGELCKYENGAWVTTTQKSEEVRVAENLIRYLEDYRESAKHRPPLYKIEFNETESEIGYESMAGEVLDRGAIETLKHFDEKWHNHPNKLGYMKTYIQDELGYRLLRIDIGDGVKTNANLYELMECSIA